MERKTWNKNSRRYKKWKRINAKNVWRITKIPLDELQTITTAYGSTELDWRKGDQPTPDGTWMLSSESFKRVS